MQPIFYGTVCPLLSYYVVKKMILDPMESRRKAAEREAQLDAVRERVALAKVEAEASVNLMRERYVRSREEEEAKKGLVIVRAIYGKIMAGQSVSQSVGWLS